MTDKGLQNAGVARPKKMTSSLTADLAVQEERIRLATRLHDGICQHLTGTVLLAKTLSNRLHASSAPEAKEAQELVLFLNQASTEIRQLMKELGGN